MQKFWYFLAKTKKTKRKLAVKTVTIYTATVTARYTQKTRLHYAFCLKIWIRAVYSGYHLYRCGIPLPLAGGKSIPVGKKTLGVVTISLCQTWDDGAVSVWATQRTVPSRLTCEARFLHIKIMYHDGRPCTIWCIVSVHRRQPITATVHDMLPDGPLNGSTGATNHPLNERYLSLDLLCTNTLAFTKFCNCELYIKKIGKCCLPNQVNIRMHAQIRGNCFVFVFENIRIRIRIREKMWQKMLSEFDLFPSIL
jgi:hypothetical protein